MEETKKETKTGGSDLDEIFRTYFLPEKITIYASTVSRNLHLLTSGLEYEAYRISKILKNVVESEQDEKYKKEFSEYLNELNNKIRPELKKIKNQFEDYRRFFNLVGIRLHDRFLEKLSQIL
ncbi:MAG: hypothetical protein QXL14_02620 [Candidatus Aenigmatarchaeota archaeon]